jgi:hypothetical protein
MNDTPFFQLVCGRISGFTVVVLAVAAGLLAFSGGGSHGTLINVGASLVGSIGFIFAVGVASYEKPSLVINFLFVLPVLGGCYYAGMTQITSTRPILGGIFFVLAAVMLFLIIPRKAAPAGPATAQSE